MTRSSSPPRRGFTLLEVLIVLALGALLLAVALPAYQGTVRQTRRSEAFDAAAGVLQAQERWRGNQATYTGRLADLSTAATTAGGLYALALSNAGDAGYTLTLTGVAGKSQAADSGCTVLTVTVANGDPAYAPATCWKR